MPRDGGGGGRRPSFDGGRRQIRREEPPAAVLRLDRSLLVGLDGPGEFDEVHADSLARIPASSRQHPGRTGEDAENPNDRRLPRDADGRWSLDMQLLFSCSSVVIDGGPPSGKIAGSAAAWHPARGSTRRR